VVKISPLILTSGVNTAMKSKASSSISTPKMTSSITQVNSFVKDGTIVLLNVRNMTAVNGIHWNKLVYLKHLNLIHVLLLMLTINWKISGLLPLVLNVKSKEVLGNLRLMNVMLGVTICNILVG
jgi:hypothetical protein